MTTLAPVACTLGASDFAERIASIEALNRRSLVRQERDDLVLRLVYEPGARAAVEALVAQERACCAFLDFDLAETRDGLRLTITAPERARTGAEAMFDEFAGAPAPARSGGCGCA